MRSCKYFKHFICDRHASTAFRKNILVAAISNRHRCLTATWNHHGSFRVRCYSSQHDSPRCLYALLNVPRDASQTDIKSAYYKLSMLYHPDKNDGDEEAAAKFRDISSAYEILSDEEQRRDYDRSKKFRFIRI